MRALIAIALLVVPFAAPASADNYPVSGRWGQSASTDKGAIDCTGKRVIAFNGNQRTDSGGGAPAYRNRTVTPSGSGFRIIDEFTTGQISNAHVIYDLRKVDADHIELALQSGGALKLQRCK